MRFVVLNSPRHCCSESLLIWFLGVFLFFFCRSSAVGSLGQQSQRGPGLYSPRVSWVFPEGQVLNTSPGGPLGACGASEGRYKDRSVNWRRPVCERLVAGPLPTGPGRVQPEGATWVRPPPPPTEEAVGVGRRSRAGPRKQPPAVGTWNVSSRL